MRKLLAFGLALVALVVVGSAFVGARPMKGIEGTYRLVSRDLPDGTTVDPPEIAGLITYDHGYRNFNIYWKDADGNPVSLGSVSRYQLTEDSYTETNVYHVESSSDSGVTYDLSDTSGTVTVTRDGGAITMDLPLWGEPHVVIDENGLTATREGAFVDHWEKVK